MEGELVEVGETEESGRGVEAEGTKRGEEPLTVSCVAIFVTTLLDQRCCTVDFCFRAGHSTAVNSGGCLLKMIC